MIYGLKNLGSGNSIPKQVNTPYAPLPVELEDENASLVNKKELVGPLSKYIPQSIQQETFSLHLFPSLKAKIHKNISWSLKKVFLL